MTTNPEARLEQLGLTLPEVRAPVANFVPYVRSGDLVFISGQVPFDEAGNLLAGRVEEDFTVEEATAIARSVGLTLLAVMREAAGSLDRVRRVVKITGYVNAPGGFGKQPLVVNGVSDLLVEVLGDRGRHARAAVGAGSLPGNVPVEVEAIIEVG